MPTVGTHAEKMGCRAEGIVFHLRNSGNFIHKPRRLENLQMICPKVGRKAEMPSSTMEKQYQVCREQDALHSTILSHVMGRRKSHQAGVTSSLDGV